MTSLFRPTFARTALTALGACLLTLTAGACASSDPLVSSAPDPAPVGSRSIGTPGLSSPGIASPSTNDASTSAGGGGFPSRGGLGGSGAFRGGR